MRSMRMRRMRCLMRSGYKDKDEEDKVPENEKDEVFEDEEVEVPEDNTDDKRREKVQTLHNMNPFGALVVALSSAKQSKQGMEILLGSRKTRAGAQCATCDTHGAANNVYLHGGDNCVGAQRTECDMLSIPTLCVCSVFDSVHLHREGRGGGGQNIYMCNLRSAWVAQTCVVSILQWCPFRVVEACLPAAECKGGQCRQQYRCMGMLVPISSVSVPPAQCVFGVARLLKHLQPPPWSATLWYSVMMALEIGNYKRRI
eukprot:1155672-Pelagomonas_calceolata.AAC.9